MVDYMYTGTYADWPAEANEQDDVRGEGRSCFSEPMIFHANMVSLADMYMISGLRKLAEAKFKSAVRQTSNPRRLFDSVSAIYALEADSCRTFRKTIILWLRWLAARTSDADDVTSQLKDVMTKVPEFAIDFAMSVYHEPVLGYCSACGDDKIVPVEPLQCRCQRCRKGGASTLARRV
ncbi:hypothetical protein HC256_004131 [Beauveria bassiana]|nr:hypothetical protein HC256_004131 [Beauveria bassiana]